MYLIFTIWLFQRSGSNYVHKKGTVSCDFYVNLHKRMILHSSIYYSITTITNEFMCIFHIDIRIWLLVLRYVVCNLKLYAFNKTVIKTSARNKAFVLILNRSVTLSHLINTFLSNNFCEGWGWEEKKLLCIYMYETCQVIF